MRMLRALLRPLPAILAFFLPGALFLGFLKAWFLQGYGRQFNGTLLVWIVSESGVLLTLCVWLGMRASARKRGDDQEVRLSPGGIAVVVVWSFLLSVALTFLYEACFCFGSVLPISDAYGHKLTFWNFLTAYLPDPRVVGVPMFVLGIFTAEGYTGIAIFLASLVGYLALYRRVPKKDTGDTGQAVGDKMLTIGGEG